MKLLALLLISAECIAADHYLWGDVASAGADICVFTRGTTLTESNVVVDQARGHPSYGFRGCLVNITNDPKTGTVYLAAKSSYSGVVSSRASFKFSATPTAPANLRCTQ